MRGLGEAVGQDGAAVMAPLAHRLDLPEQLHSQMSTVLRSLLVREPVRNQADGPNTWSVKHPIHDFE